MMATSALNDGRAYGRREGRPDDVLTKVGPGTPGGELLRRYWQPIALSAEAVTVPKLIRRFGEELLLFRNGRGEPAILLPRCIHRGSSLFYGKVEDDGIRCCYHGWKFGCQGQVLDQPQEPGGGLRKHKLRQPWYPVLERFGAIWAYMGPADKQPLFPRYSIFENIGEGEEVTSNYMHTGRELADFPARFNWFQAFENGVDQHHIPVLHNSHSGPQLGDERFNIDAEFSWETSASQNSILAISRRKLNGSSTWVRIEQIMLPNIFALAPIFGDGITPHLWFFVPLDDTSHVQIEVMRRTKDFVWDAGKIAGYGADGKFWRDMTPDERQRSPSDQEAQESQGSITLHSEEHLAASDKGIVKLRLLFKRLAKIVAEGGDPAGVAFSEDARRVEIEGRSWVESEEEAILERA